MRAIVILFVLFIQVSKAQLELIPTNTGKYLTQLSVIKKNVVVTGREDYMAKSLDACNTFTLCNLPGPQGYQNYLCRVDTNTQYLLSSSLPAYNNKIYKSTNGGNNWTLKIDTSNMVLLHLCFFDSLEGISFDSFSLYTTVLRTKNGGNGWTPSVSSSLFGTVTTLKRFGDSTICVGSIHGSTGSILVSKDRGNTWQSIGGGGFPDSQPTDVFFLNRDTIFGCSSYGKKLSGSPMSYFTKTFNGGTDWKNIPLTDHYTYHGIHFKNAKEGYVVGMNDLKEGIILKTTDLGETWETFNTHLKTQLSEIEFLNDSIALVSGSGGVLFKWNSKQSVFTGVKENTLDENSVTIFPNPVKDKLLFESSIHLEKVTISNTVGQELFAIEKPQAKEKIDLSSLPAGIYYLKASSKAGHKVFKILKE